MPRSFLPSVLLGFATTALLAQVQPAQALQAQVVVAGETYDVTAEEIAYDDPGASARFDLIANGGEMPWWGRGDLARTFAEAVGDRLGSQAPVTDEFGPLFAFATGTDQAGLFVDTWTQSLLPPPSQFNYQPGTSERFRYAFAEKVPTSTSVPGPLPILGVSVCFGYARRLRRRQRALLPMD
jgi:hypothetical protein